VSDTTVMSMDEFTQAEVAAVVERARWWVRGRCTSRWTSTVSTGLLLWEEPEVGGFTSRGDLSLLRGLGVLHIVGADVVEDRPAIRSHNEHGAACGAAAIRRILRS